jgi:beta-lactam-binding protein with PASTA domain
LGVAALLALVGCEKKEAAVPNVIGQRLDLAQSHMKDAGLKYEAIGGGTFGILDESNWTVCSTEPVAGQKSSDKAVKLIVDRVCSTSQSGTVNQSSSSTTTTSPSAGAVSEGSITVPNVVGKDLQTAQDTMQAAGLRNLTSHDSTGQGRLQLVDRNWKVTEQSPAAGTKANSGQEIDLGAKKFTD